MEPEGSLACSQEPITGPLPEAVQSTVIPCFFKICILILYAICVYVFKQSLFLRFTMEILYAFFISTICGTQPAHLIPFDLITLIMCSN
jgi:hypothetical protein